MEDLFALITKTYGIAGLIMLSPFAGLVVVWRHNVKLQEEIKTLNKENKVAVEAVNAALTKVQESRVSDSKAMSEKILTFVAENATVSSEIAQALEQVRELLMKITTEIISKRS